jgi:hypothetical protein
MKIKQSVNINAESRTEAGEVIAYFNANVAEANSNISMTIQNQALYDANKALVRQDKADFDAYVYDVEDKQTPQA